MNINEAVTWLVEKAATVRFGRIPRGNAAIDIRFELRGEKYQEQFIAANQDTGLGDLLLSAVNRFSDDVDTLLIKWR